MKIALYSDLHLEFADFKPPQKVLDEADVVVLAGDIGLGLDGPEWATKTFEQPIIFVPGNHEYYRQYFDGLNDAFREFGEKHPNFHPLIAGEGVTIDRTRFFGGTLWTDCELYPGTPLCAHLMNDYNLIKRGYGGTSKLRPIDTMAEHAQTRAKIEAEYGTVDVVVTHHCPSIRSINFERYGDDPIQGMYASHMDNVVEEMGAKFWFCGHTHSCNDYKIGETRVVQNCRGYYRKDGTPREGPNGFNAELMLEL